MMLICIVLALAILLCLIPQRLNAEPVFRPDVDRSHVAGLKKSLTPLMALSEDELARLIPDRSGFRFVDCPNCEGGAEENQLSWSIEDPDRVFCLFCGMRFPNEVYPENGVNRVTNPRGEVQEYPYWEAPFAPPAQLQGPLSHIEPDTKLPALFPGEGMVRRPGIFLRCGASPREALSSDRESRVRAAGGVDSGPVRSGLSGGIVPDSMRRSAQR